MKLILPFLFGVLLVGCVPVPVVVKKYHFVHFIPLEVRITDDSLYLTTDHGVFLAARKSPTVSTGARATYRLRLTSDPLPLAGRRIPVSLGVVSGDSFTVIDTSALEQQRVGSYLEEKRRLNQNGFFKFKPFPASTKISEAYGLESSNDFPSDHVPGAQILVFDSETPQHFSILVIPHDATYTEKPGLGIRLVPDVLKGMENVQ